MITIVSDTSPINYLVLIGEINVLPELFQEVLIPPAVLRELQHAKTPKPVFDWAANLPAWAQMAKPLQLDASIGLGAGENEAISLALERHIPAILIDDRDGWLAAEARSILPVGTINIIESAALYGLLDFEQVIAKLKATNFRIEERIINLARQRVSQGKQNSSN